MNERRIALGLAAWLLGVLVPAYVYVELFTVMYSTYSLPHLASAVFDHIPWFVWLYYVPMSVAGLILAVSGFGFGRTRAADSPPTPQ